MGRYADDAFVLENAEVQRETEKAVLVKADNFDDPVWVPKSQIHEDSKVRDEGDEGDLLVKRWFAEQRDWA